MSPARAVVLTGGPTHDFPATTACLAGLLAEQGLTADVYEDVDAGLRALPGARCSSSTRCAGRCAGPALHSATGHSPTPRHEPGRGARPRSRAPGRRLWRARDAHREHLFRRLAAVGRRARRRVALGHSSHRRWASWR